MVISFIGIVCSRKNAQSLRITILQKYASESCRFQQIVQKEKNVYMTCRIRQLNILILCFAAGNWQVNSLKTKLTANIYGKFMI